MKAEPRTMIASEKGGRAAEEQRGRSAFLDARVERSQRRLLELGGVTAISRTCSIDGRRLHYLQAGDGPPLVMLHGASGGAANWYRLMAPLSRRFRVIAFDLPGFGLSDALEPEAPLGRQVAACIARCLAEIDLTPAHIVGTSFGGLAATRLAQLISPTSLILLNAAGLWPEASFKLRLACLPLFQRLALKQTVSGARWTLRHVLTARRLDPEHETALIDYLYWSAARSDARALGRAYALFGGLRGQHEVVTGAELSALECRTLLIWGERDGFLPAPPHRIESILAAGAQLRIIPGVGHSPNWEAVDEVLEAIFDFVSGSENEAD